MLSEADAWREIARRVDRLPTGEGYLCDQVGYLSGYHRADYEPFDYSDDLAITDAVAERMLARVRARMEPDTFSAYDDNDLTSDRPEMAEFRQARVLAALWLALDAESESVAVSLLPGEET